jgi:hypothetical protein
MVVMSPEIRFITTVERLVLRTERTWRLITITKRLEPAKRWSRGPVHWRSPRPDRCGRSDQKGAARTTSTPELSANSAMLALLGREWRKRQGAGPE